MNQCDMKIITVRHMSATGRLGARFIVRMHENEDHLARRAVVPYDYSVGGDGTLDKNRRQAALEFCRQQLLEISMLSRDSAYVGKGVWAFVHGYGAQMMNPFGTLRPLLGLCGYDAGFLLILDSGHHPQ